MIAVLSFFRAFRDLWQKTIFGFTLAVPAVAVIIWLAIAGVLLSVFSGQIENTLMGISWLSGLRDSFAALGLSLSTALILILLFFLFAPLVYWTSLIVFSLIALPWIMRYLRPKYPLAFREHQSLAMISTWRWSAKVFLKATPLYAVLLATAWMPGVFVVGNFILGAWVNAHFLAIEILCEVTAESEMRDLMIERRENLFLMGCVLMALLMIPIVQLVVPVFGGLWFAHDLLAEIERRRARHV